MARTSPLTKHANNAPKLRFSVALGDAPTVDVALVMRQHGRYLERRRREVSRGDPGRQAQALAKRTANLDGERRGHWRQNARGVLGDGELDDLLAEVERQRGDVERALRSARGRRQAVEELQAKGRSAVQLSEHFAYIGHLVASPQDRRRLYGALRLEAEVNEDRTVRLSGIFDPDIYLPGALRDGPADPSEPVPQGTWRGAGSVLSSRCRTR